MNILLIGYCYLADGFLYASKSLEKYNYKIYFFPYFNYKLDNNQNLLNDFKKSLNDNKIDICLWWNNSISYNEIINMLSKKYLNIFFNWDPFLYDYQKYNNSEYFWKDIIDNKKKIYGLMDHIFTCFEKEKEYFNKNNIYYNPPGFDKNISKYVNNKKYECDISFILTNLYNDNNQFPCLATNLNRYDIVNDLYKNRNNFKFHIYGPKQIGDIYPECYKGPIRYNECNLVFSNSKINLSIHPIIYELNKYNSKEEYFSERVPQILGCKGLLMTNSYFNNILINNEDYIHIDKNIDYISLIKYIINNYEKYERIKINGYNKALNNYQWDNWASIIQQKIECKIFKENELIS